MIRASLNELGFLTRWAARGVGVPVGLAEDLAGAARVLALAGLNPTRLLVPALDALSANHSWGALEVDRGGRLLSRQGVPLSAIEGGPALADLMDQGSQVSVVAMDHPMLAIATVAGLGATGWLLSGTGVSARLGGGHFLEIGATAEDALYAPGPAPLSCLFHVDGQSPAPLFLGPEDFNSRALGVLSNGVLVGAADWQRLKTLAGRAWVPSSEESRMAGAGAGLIDTD